jgi:hypothetical protein
VDALPAVGHDVGLRLALVAAMASLPIEQPQPLLLVTVEQLSYAECAEVLRDLLDGRSPSQVRGLRRCACRPLPARGAALSRWHCSCSAAPVVQR